MKRKVNNKFLKMFLINGLKNKSRLDHGGHHWDRAGLRRRWPSCKRWVVFFFSALTVFFWWWYDLCKVMADGGGGCDRDCDVRAGLGFGFLE